MSLAVALATAFPLAANGMQPLAPGELKNASTTELAQRVLDSDLAPSAVSHRLEDRHLVLASDTPGYGAIRLFMRPATAADGIRQRDTWYVPLQRMVDRADSPYRTGEAQGPTPQLAIAADCTAAADAAFGWYSSNRPIEQAIAVLAYLMAIQQQAREGAELPFSVTCRSTLPVPSDDPCQPGALQVLRTLPLDHLLSITFDRGVASGNQGWILSVGPNGPSHAFFQIRLPENVTAAGTLDLVWMLPFPS